MLRLVLIFASAMLFAGMAATWTLRRAAPTRAMSAAEVQRVKDWLPDDALYTKEEIGSEFDLQKITPFGDQRLFFEFLVPKAFEQRSLPVSPEQRAMDAQVPVPLAQLGPRGRKDVSLEVRYLRVPPRVTLEKFMELFADRSGCTIVAQQRAEFHGRLVQDALVRLAPPQLGAVLTRVTASRRGDLIFMVGGSAREADYPHWKRIFGVAAVTFEPAAVPPR